MIFRISLLFASITPLAGRVLAQSASGGAGHDFQWVSYVLNGGPFAIVVFLLVTDRLTTPGERDRLRTELTASHEREERLNNNIREDFIPLMTKAHEAIARSTEATERITTLYSIESRLHSTDGKE